MPGLTSLPAAVAVPATKQSAEPRIFDPSIHLAYEPPSKTYTLEEISLPPSPISPIASTVPFPFLTPEAIEAHRREIFSPDVINNCMYNTLPGSVQLRGMAPRYAPFIHQFWTSPEVLGIVSQLAGVDLIPVFDYDICHVNVQMPPGGKDAVKDTPIKPPMATEEAIAAFQARKTGQLSKRDSGINLDSTGAKTIVPWHKDSYPFVLVVMLSDAQHMTDGETELMKGDGTTMKVRSPGMGGAVLLQGRQISHVALPAGNMPERVTIVTSFRPRDPLLTDSSTCMNVRPVSLLPEMYYQWTTYRLKLLSERFKHEAKLLDQKYAEAVARMDSAGRPGHCSEAVVDLEQLTKWMDNQMRYMKQTMYEMRPVTAEDSAPGNEVTEITL
ncbi:hypothetical protein LTS18_006580 [Coniosporium uncinatum]|uniref:Uncharacterized protein n=1 Tax=Coniosporium uncinatum TaxID=93489 RepID=A0ACC3D3V3_9PEZI|nr:hypothetical protein LTS18_006580 [Coniosporium uncinatum]